MEISQVNLGKRIKELRLKAGLSQDQLARSAEIPYTTLTKIETGVIKNPSIFAIKKITRALGSSIDKIVE